MDREKSKEGQSQAPAETTNSEAAASKDNESKAAEAKVAASKVAESKVAASKDDESKVAASKAAEAKVAASKAAEAKDDESTAVESKEPLGASEPPGSVQPESNARRSGKVGRTTGVLAVYDHPHTILNAAARARDEGFEKWDVYTPFPVHGMDDAMGLGPSPVPWITFTMGVVGFAAAIIIQFGAMVYSWPLNYGGKPFAAWPSFIPITFEMTVFFAGVSTAVGSLVLGGMFKLRRRKRVPHPAVTSHRFAIFVEAEDPKFDEDGTLSLFEGTGAIEVRAVKEGE